MKPTNGSSTFGRSTVGELTDKRKENLTESGKGKNSMFEPGLKPSGPESTDLNVNLEDVMAGPIVRWASIVGGAALTGYGVYKLAQPVRRGRSKPWLSSSVLTLLGAGLVYRGITGVFGEDDEMGYEDVGGLQGPEAVVPHLEGLKVEASIVVDRSQDELYHFWRDFENLPKIMSHLESVEVIDDNLSHWVAKAPLGTTVEWDAEVYIEKHGELISWRSTEDTEVDNAGSVRFEPSSNGGTVVTVMLKYDPPAGQAGAALAKLFGDDPQTMVEEDLRNFKQAVEGHEFDGAFSLASMRHSMNGHSKN
jgi:uncharacterized membrane protein